jgi:hypothetical protein
MVVLVRGCELVYHREAVHVCDSGGHSSHGRRGSSNSRGGRLEIYMRTYVPQWLPVCCNIEHQTMPQWLPVCACDLCLSLQHPIPHIPGTITTREQPLVNNILWNYAPLHQPYSSAIVTPSPSTIQNFLGYSFMAVGA